MKLAYIILAHKNAPQVKRLYDALNDDDSYFVIHVSKTSENRFYLEIKALLNDKPNVFFCKREDGTHYSFGVIKGIIKALKALINNNIDFDYVNLISGQDYPIKSPKEIKNFFSQNSGKEYLQYWPLFPSEDSVFYNDHPWGSHRQLYRIDRYHIKFCGKKQSIPELTTRRLIDHNFYKTLKIFLNESPKYLKEKRWQEEFLLFAFSRLMPEKRKILSGFEFFGGKTWWSLSNECIRYIVDFYDNNRKFNRFFKFTLIPDEMYFQTVLLNSKFKDRLVNNYMREIDWNRGDGTHPVYFTKDDFPRLKDSESLFARKFDFDNDMEIFDLIDSYITSK